MAEMRQWSDEDVVEVARGEGAQAEAAWRELNRRFMHLEGRDGRGREPWLVRVTWHRCGPRYGFSNLDAEGDVLEAATIAWARAARYLKSYNREKGAFKAWLSTVLNHTIHDTIDRRFSTERRTDDSGHAVVTDEDMAQVLRRTPRTL